MLNSQSIVQSVPERGHLKNLGSWLGSLTLASDRPIKTKNIAFKELLIEAYDSKRLLAVIPFVCKVLDQASKSLVFKPPNPWLMEIIKLLVELYHFGELKLNGKFEVEVLCKDLGLDHNTIEPSTALRDRPNPEDELALHAPQDDLDCFEDTFLANRQGIRSERFSSEAITSSLPDLGPLLVYPPSTHTMVSQARLRQIVQTSVQRAIYEIISPVVERSVTIAAISTQQLIHKDFATEPNEERVRQSAITMVKALAGSLALVTCKEPLRMSMTNYIRMMSAELGDQALPEGAILMCVNDNLDAACGLVENAAEQKSMPEIEENIEQQLRARRQHRAARPNEPYVDPICNRWSTYIPEPYKPSATGLNKEQMGIYEEFARQSRGPSIHANGPSMDSGRSIGNEAMADQFPAVPNLPTPAEPPAIPRQTGQQQQRLQGSHMTGPTSHPLMNGYADPKAVSERLQILLGELQNAAREAPEQHAKDLRPHSPTLQIFDRILRLILDSPNREDLCLSAARWASSVLYTQTEKTLEVEALVQLLHKLCHLSALTAKEVILWLASQKEEAYFNVTVTVALLETGLIEIHRVDTIIAKALSQRKAPALDLLHNILDEVLLNDNPIALRADFVNSLQAVGQWLYDSPDLPAENNLIQLAQRLKEAGVSEISVNPPDELSLVHRDQIEYIFVEWVRLCSFPATNEHAYYAFISQMHRKKLMSSDADSCLFFRLCIDMSVEAFEREEMNPGGKVSDAYIQTDALARMIALLTKFHGESDGAVKLPKSEYLYSILSLVVLVLCHHHNERGDHCNQKVFFRLFSSILCETKMINRESAEGEKDSMMVFAKIFLTLQADYFPGFAFGWLTLISHRIFMPGMLLLSDHTAWDAYAKLIKALLTYVGEQLKPVNISSIAKDLYRGVLRVLLVLHHDFPEFLAENHVMLCSVVPAHCTQLRNLILSAYPSSFPELPDPFTAGLKVDRIVEIRNTPQINVDIEGPLRRANIKDLVDACISGEATEEIVANIARAVDDAPEHETGVAYGSVHVDTAILNSLVLYIGTSAIAGVEQKGGPTFVPTSRQAHLMAKLVRELRPEARYYFLSAVANQLRYPNSHTHYFSYTLLYLFGSDLNDQQESDVKQQITRVLLERLIVHRPHPWGLIITLLELLKNPDYMFWDLPFIKAAPEVCISNLNKGPPSSHG
jgi:CCR4-NOT transcription complex subunit 1